MSLDALGCFCVTGKIDDFINQHLEACSFSPLPNKTAGLGILQPSSHKTTNLLPGYPLLLCCDANILTRPHKGHLTTQHWVIAPAWEPNPVTHRSPALHTIVACFTSWWEAVGDIAVNPIKVQQGRELNYSWAFLSACKNHQIFKKRPNSVIYSFCEGRCFIFTHRPSNGQQLSLAILSALI